ncbi:hypothetical protein B0O80DRAFT_473529 [Mortierella sp. GBAus27b]|nr:hypothetical protein B0O80DRAFT_473529 [Mortierella sp. GBAus27b]
MSDSDRPFEKLTEAVSCWTRSAKWRDYRFPLLLTTYIYDAGGKHFLVQDRPERYPFEPMYGLDTVQACDHSECLGQTWCNESGACTHSHCDGKPVCGLPWLRTGEHCQHDKCYSLLQCCHIRRPLKNVSLENDDKENADPAEQAPGDSASPFSQSSYSTPDGNDDADGDRQGVASPIHSVDSTVNPVSPSSTLESSDSFGRGSPVMESAPSSGSLVTAHAEEPSALSSPLGDREQYDSLLGQQEGLSIDVPPSDEDAPNVRNDSAESSNRRSKRKAEIIEDVEQDTGHNGVLPRPSIRTQSSQSVLGSRVLSVLQSLGRRHELMVGNQALAFVKHHEEYRRDGSSPLYLDSPPGPTINDLTLQIGRLEQEIHYCMDLYHTTMESHRLGSGQLPAPRGDTWFDRQAQERYNKRRAL